MLRSLRTHGFRGQDLDIHFGDKDTIISGDNGEGKTTTMHAVLNLLYSCDADDKQNYNLFDNNKESSPESPLSCWIESDFEIDGVGVKLRKEAEQVYRRNRTTGEVERANDAYKYYIDDLEVSATKYAQFITDNFGRGGWLKLMLNPRYWEMLDARTLRNYFADIVGEITAQDFEGDYAEVMPLIAKQGAENARKTYQKEITDFNKIEVQQSATIKAASEALPDLTAVKDAEDTAVALETEKQGLEQRRMALTGQNDEIVAKRKADEDAISAKRKELIDAQHYFEQDQSFTEDALVAKLNEAKENNATTNRRRQQAESDVENLKLRLSTERMRLEEMRNELKTIKLRTFDGVCSVCGNSYIGAERTKRLELFRAKKETDEKNKIEEGKKQAERVSQLETSLAEAEARLATTTERVDIRPIEDALVEFRRNKRAWEVTDEYKRLTAELTELEANRTEIPTNEEVVEIQKRVGEIDSMLKEAYQVIGLRKVHDDGIARIEDMKEQRRATMQAIATATKRKTLVEQYQREYADIVRTRVNKNFRNVKVEMTTTNKSGDIIDTCKLRLDGVTDTYNYANKVKIGIEVAQVFQKHFGVCLPLFVDNAESITEIPEHDGQRVMLRVVKGEKLTIETKG